MNNKKLSLTIHATVSSKAKLGQPKIIKDKDPSTGKMFYRKVTTFDQESTVDLEFPIWPLAVKYIPEAITSLRGQIAKVVIEQLERARKNIEVEVLVEPIVYEKLDKHYMATEVDKKYGFAFKYPIEHKEHELEAFFVSYTVPFIGNHLKSEITIHDGINLIAPSIIKELTKKGAVS